MKRSMMKALAAALVLVMLVLPVSVFAEEGVTYELLGTLELGEKTYESSALAYTVVTLEPTEIGKYTISTSNSTLGIVSYNGYWVTDEPTESNVTQTSVDWNCTAVGQKTLIAVLSKPEGLNITVAKDGIVIDHYPTVYYENKTKPQRFTFDGKKSDLVYVNVEDGVKSTAVLGADGFYHLDGANGPKLYACLNETMMSLFDVRDPGQLVAYVYGEDGKVEYKVDYNGAFDEYWACVDTATGFYPLTNDLIVLFKNVGDFQEWYGEGGWLGVDAEDGWMYACYYKEGEVFENNEIVSDDEKEDSDTIGGIISDGGDGGVKPGEGVTSGIGSDGNYVGGISSGAANSSGATPGAAGSTGGATTSHQTGDTSVVIICVLAAALVGVVVAVILIKKKKNTVEF